MPTARLRQELRCGSIIAARGGECRNSPSAHTIARLIPLWEACKLHGVPRVRRSTKILLAGLCLSALVLAAGYLSTLRLERRLKVLQAECGVPASPEAHGPWEKYTAHGPDTVPVRMPDGTVVRLPNKPNKEFVKQLRADLDPVTTRAAGADEKVAGHFVPDSPDTYFVPPDQVPPGANFFDQFDKPPAKWALDYVRTTYPQYKDLPDEELARKLHEKYQGPQWLHAPLVCDAQELSTVELKAGGVQAKIVDADRDIRSSRSWPLPVALAVLSLSALPWLWYAFLRRIAELRVAIGGNPPES
jgi:hypothetical protein